MAGFDVYHMNIEDKHPLQDVRPAGAGTAHLQVCGTDRGAPGSSHFGWPCFAEAVRDMGYSGPTLTTDPTIPRAETTHAFAPRNSDSCR